MLTLNGRWFTAKKEAEQAKLSKLQETDLLKKRNKELEYEINSWKDKVKQSIEREVSLSERIKQLSNNAHPNHKDTLLMSRGKCVYHGNAPGWTLNIMWTLNKLTIIFLATVEIMNLLKRSILELISYQKQMNIMLEQRYIARSKLSNDDIRNKIICQEKMDHCYSLVKKLSDRLIPHSRRRTSQIRETKQASSLGSQKRVPWDNR